MASGKLVLQISSIMGNSKLILESFILRVPVNPVQKERNPRWSCRYLVLAKGMFGACRFEQFRPSSIATLGQKQKEHLPLVRVPTHK